MTSKGIWKFYQVKHNKQKKNNLTIFFPVKENLIFNSFAKEKKNAKTN